MSRFAGTFTGLFIIAVCCTVSSSSADAPNQVKSAAAVRSLQAQLKSSGLTSDVLLADAAFSTTSLSRADAAEATRVLWEAHANRIRDERTKEMRAKTVTLKGKAFRFEYRVFGAKPQSGRSLYLSLHGGGGSPARVNDQQWHNQIRLYQPKEGICLAPRAPTDKWNQWHQSHIDDLFDRLIQNMIVLNDINPDRVYLMGYSAGGDGVYQIAPRMADRWAAAAMMAGHPNDASPLGLRNIGFALHVGGLDGAYERNRLAEEWGKRLDQLQADDPEGYRHQVKIHPGKGHWMDRQDAVAVDWMAGFTRNPYPNRVVWVQDDVTHQQFYWLRIGDAERRKGATIVVRRDGQAIEFDEVAGVGSLTVLLNDQMVNLDQPIEIKMGGKILFRGVAPRTIKSIVNSLTVRHDPRYLFSAEVSVRVD